MGLNSSIPVRFSQSSNDRLKSISTNTGIPVSQLIRIATEQWLFETEKSRSISIPVHPMEDKPRGGKNGL